MNYWFLRVLSKGKPIFSTPAGNIDLDVLWGETLREKSESLYRIFCGLCSIIQPTSVQFGKTFEQIMDTGSVRFMDDYNSDHRFRSAGVRYGAKWFLVNDPLMPDNDVWLVKSDVDTPSVHPYHLLNSGV